MSHITCPTCMTATTEDRGVVCPFCDEDDFDLLGLKIHYERGWCDPYNKLHAKCIEPDCCAFGQRKVSGCGCIAMSEPK